jgi:hypothetical protein
MFIGKSTKVVGTDKRKIGFEIFVNPPTWEPANP